MQDFIGVGRTYSRFDSVEAVVNLLLITVKYGKSSSSAKSHGAFNINGSKSLLSDQSTINLPSNPANAAIVHVHDASQFFVNVVAFFYAKIEQLTGDAALFD